MRMERPSGPSATSRPQAVILAGGRSSRFGCDKARFRFGGTTMLQSLAEMLETAGFHIAISTSHKAHEQFGYPVIWDKQSYQGPLFALKQVFQNLSADSILLCACDTPLINPQLPRWMWNRSMGCDVTLLKDDSGHPSMLPGIYSRRLLPAIADNISSGDRSLKSLLNRSIKIKAIQRSEWMRLDKSGRSLVNINTPHDLQEVDATAPT